MIANAIHGRIFFIYVCNIFHHNKHYFYIKSNEIRTLGTTEIYYIIGYVIVLNEFVNRQYIDI